MKTKITLNITHLIGTLIIIGDNKKASLKLQKDISETLIETLSRIQSEENSKLDRHHGGS